MNDNEGGKREEHHHYHQDEPGGSMSVIIGLVLALAVLIVLIIFIPRLFTQENNTIEIDTPNGQIDTNLDGDESQNQ